MNAEHYPLSVFYQYCALEFFLYVALLKLKSSNKKLCTFLVHIKRLFLHHSSWPSAAVATAASAIFFMSLAKRIPFTFCSFHWTFTYILFSFLHSIDADVFFLQFCFTIYGQFSFHFFVFAFFAFIFYLLIKKRMKKTDTIVRRTAKYSFVKLQHTKNSRKISDQN